MAQTIRNVPPENVGEVVQSMVDTGNTNVTVTQQENGNFTIRGE